MQLNPISHVNAAGLPLEKLAANPHLSEEQKLAEAGREFEAVLLRHILKEAQRPMFPSALQGPSAVSDIYQDILASHLADVISKSRGIGLGNALATQLRTQTTPATISHQAERS